MKTQRNAAGIQTSFQDNDPPEILFRHKVPFLWSPHPFEKGLHSQGAQFQVKESRQADVCPR
jgi:hypothetical protein